MGNSWKYMRAEDAISGKEGEVWALIPDASGNTKKVMVAECKNISAKISKNKSEFKALGYRGTQHKATGWSGTGSLTIYYASSYWSKMMISYAKTGKDVYFTLVVKNEDPTSKIGGQTVSLIDCNLDEAEVAKLDTGSEFLDATMNFTFSDIDMPEEFEELNSNN